MVIILWIFSITAFIGASLLFMIQPMAGRLVLPIFGGASTVWTAVMLFFTVILLFGYGYVVLITGRPKKQQFLLHSIVILVSLIWLIINFSVSHRFFSLSLYSFTDNLPVVALLLMMIKVLALPCFLLATTSALLQNWFAGLLPGKSPYWLYIVSNAGSLIGLLAYPFIIEPHLTLQKIQTLWIFGFGFYCLLMLLVTYFVSKSIKVVHIDSKPYVFDIKKSWVWLVLPFVSTTAMLALTNQITQEISPVPFLWVATLAVYLLSYIVAFIETKWYPRKFYGILLLCFIGILGIFTSGFIELRLQLSLYPVLTGLFLIDLVCHRELFRRRPKSGGLSMYYLMISLGGVAASIFVALIAPAIFPDIWEYPIVLIASALLGIIILFRKSSLSFRLHIGVFGFLVMLLVYWVFTYSWKASVGDPLAQNLANFRNFYGVLHIWKSGTKPDEIMLYNGGTLHGSQLIASGDDNTPTEYYTQDSGLGYAILHHPKRINKFPMRIGVIGLGVGTTAAYCGRGDSIRFYEINPQVIVASNKYFTYLKNAEKVGCKVEIVTGDARISLENELKNGQKGEFDILAVDAFTDDNIPVHLLTREAVELYLSHLSDSGVIAFHISNRHFNLAPILESIAGADKLYFYDIVTGSSRWELISRFSTSPRSYIPTAEQSKAKIWTDDYSNILQALK